MKINPQISTPAYSGGQVKPDFSSPEKTYNTLKAAAVNNDLKTFSDCFASDFLFPGYLYPGFKFPSARYPDFVQPKGVKDDNYKDQSPEVFQNWAKLTMQTFKQAINSGKNLKPRNKKGTYFEIPNILMGKKFEQTKLALLFNLNDETDGKIHQMLLKK